MKLCGVSMPIRWGCRDGSTGYVHRNWTLLSRTATDHIVKIVLTTELNTVA